MRLLRSFWCILIIKFVNKRIFQPLYNINVRYILFYKIRSYSDWRINYIWILLKFFDIFQKVALCKWNLFKISIFWHSNYIPCLFLRRYKSVQWFMHPFLCSCMFIQPCDLNVIFRGTKNCIMANGWLARTGLLGNI